MALRVGEMLCRIILMIQFQKWTDSIYQSFPSSTLPSTINLRRFIFITAKFTARALQPRYYIINLEGLLMFYRCILGGGAGDSLSFQNGTKFSTFDKNNMQNTSTNCAQDTKGGWWFNDCQRKACLTGKYKNGIRWDSWKGSNETLSKIEMKVRPVWQNVNEHGNLGFLDNRIWIIYLTVNRCPE